MPAERLVLRPPDRGHKILIAEGGLRVPDDPIIPLIEGDGIGPEVVHAAQGAIDAVVENTFGGRRRIVWYPVPAGEKAMFRYGEMLPEATLAAIREYVVALKGPLTTPVSGGFRSLNVALRKALDLYANVRPIYWIPGVPSPVSHPERLDVVIFREATEDVYAGIEWEKGSPEARRMIEILEKEFRTRVRADSGIGVKPVSETGSKRLVRKAIRYAIENGRKSVTLVHKGNIMKYTEGAFRTWGYEVARDEFRDSTISWDAIVKDHGGEAPDGKVVIKD
ncbi:MAG: NADP-dependent isocitrate dehydrogenase, partial [Methanobacteriota archaeon]